MYPKMNPHVLQSFKANQKDCRLPTLPPSALRTVTPSSLKRALAICLSRGVSLLEVNGKSGRMKIAMKAQPTVATPSTMNSHRQPRMPWAPSRPPEIAPANKPPKAPDKMAAEIKMAKRLDCSSFLYQEDIKRRTPGAKPASKSPIITLRATRCLKSLTAAMTQVRIPQQIMRVGKYRDGLTLTRIIFEGGSKMT